MRNVYILGAGASEGAGLPLMSNFLERAKDLTGIRKEPFFRWGYDILNKDREKFLNSLAWYFQYKWMRRAKIERTEDGKVIKVSFGKKWLSLILNNERVELNFENGRTGKFIAKKENGELNIYKWDDFDDIWEYINVHKLENFNIEDIFGYLEMKIDINSLDSDKNEDVHIRNLVLELIEKVIKWSYDYSDEEKVSKYSMLLEKFVKKLKNDTIISFNYDVLIDDCLDKNGLSPDYGATFENKESSKSDIQLIKLHGSLNWKICPECKKPIRLNYDYLTERRSKSATKTEYDVNDLLSNILTICPKKHNRSYMIENTLIAPPSYIKNVPHFREVINELRKSASEKLKIAEKIIFIGYSLPQTDTYFKYLLLSSLPEKEFSVEVVDPNPQNIAGRYFETFKKNDISFRAMKFEDYIPSIPE
ncbi:MAG: SIR2 family protein [Candidatus Methanoperedens sp.]|nr:SIR2 family protein [Candidatus Methanoperedens sp.]